MMQGREEVAWLWAPVTEHRAARRASKPASIRDSATPFGLNDLDLDQLRA